MGFRVSFKLWQTGVLLLLGCWVGGTAYYLTSRGGSPFLLSPMPNVAVEFDVESMSPPLKAAMDTLPEKYKGCYSRIATRKPAPAYHSFPVNPPNSLAEKLRMKRDELVQKFDKEYAGQPVRVALLYKLVQTVTPEQQWQLWRLASQLAGTGIDVWLCGEQSFPHEQPMFDPKTASPMFKAAVRDGKRYFRGLVEDAYRRNYLDQTTIFLKGFYSHCNIPAMLFSQAHPEYDHIWALEGDVNYDGHWAELFCNMQDLNGHDEILGGADLLAFNAHAKSSLPFLKTELGEGWEQAPFATHRMDIPPELRMSTIMPLTRWSRVLLHMLDYGYQISHPGQFEVTMPTYNYVAGGVMAITTPPAGRLWTTDQFHWRKDPAKETHYMAWKEAINVSDPHAIAVPKGTLWHPIKTFNSPEWVGVPGKMTEEAMYKEWFDKAEAAEAADAGAPGTADDGT